MKITRDIKMINKKTSQSVKFTIKLPKNLKKRNGLKLDAEILLKL